MTLKEHLHHLLWLMEPPFTENWKAYCWARANQLAQEDAARFASLPVTLAAAMKARQQESDSPPSGRLQ